MMLPWDLVVFNLAIGMVSGAAADGDTHINVEDAEGSALGNTLVGDANVNRLNGMAGDDTLKGGASNDVLAGQPWCWHPDRWRRRPGCRQFQDVSAGIIANFILGGMGREALGANQVSNTSTVQHSMISSWAIAPSNS